MYRIAGAAFVLFGAVVYTAAQAPPAAPFAGVLDEHPAIQYALRQPRDRVALLTEAISAGAASLRHDGSAGYLRAVLTALDVPTESQLLVFSKTGVQRGVTGPHNPRAIYFNDSVVVGYI